MNRPTSSKANRKGGAVINTQQRHHRRGEEPSHASGSALRRVRNPPCQGLEKITAELIKVQSQ